MRGDRRLPPTGAPVGVSPEPMEPTDYLRFLLALAFVLGLIGVAAWLARRFRIGGLAPSGAASRRLQVLEVAALDPRRKLVLVRRDEVEHLLLLGQDGNRIIEAAIPVGRAPAPVEIARLQRAGE